MAIPVCVVCESDGRRMESSSHDLKTLARCRPIYEALLDWIEDVTDARRPVDLPAAARCYVEFVVAGAGMPVSHVSVRPGRTQFIEMG